MDPRQILEGLTRISNEGRFFAILWHAAASVVIISLALGWRPRERYVAAALALAPLSVSLAAWASGNPFNGATFLLLAIGMTANAVRGSDARVHRGPTWAVRFGIAMMVFGWIYPHFVRVESALDYFHSAPLGLIPCPTLAFLIGTALAADGLCERRWSRWLAWFGVVYGLFGVLVLGVYSDVLLLAGALALMQLIKAR